MMTASPSRPLALSLAAFSLAALATSNLPGQSTVLHFSISDSDAATVGTGVLPGVDSSPDGTISGSLTLSDDLPTEGVPAGAGNRSLVFNGGELVTIPGTQQLSHEAVIAAGGFTYETWFKWNGGGTLNAMIDYAGTEKFRIDTGTGNLDFNFDGGTGPQVLGTPTIDQWHYVAMVFEHNGDPVDVNMQISGTMTWYFDSNEAAGSIEAIKDDFGDSLNRTIGVGGHPLGFGADFYTGLLFEPRVTLGALESSELLYGGGGSGEIVITDLNYNPDPVAPEVTLTWSSNPGTAYRVEYSTDLEVWNTVIDTVGEDEATSTSITHEFSPGFPDLVGSKRVFYRVRDDLDLVR